MPSRMKRYQETGQLHYITFTCYHRLKHLETESARDIFEQILERVRRFLPLVSFVNLLDRLWKARDALTMMVKDIEIAKEVNQQIREACRILDESAALVRETGLGDAREYIVAVGRVFEAISAELLDPLYKEHPQIAPAGWQAGERNM